MELKAKKDKKEINILFLGGAKRVSLARKVIAAGERLGVKVGIYSYELSPEAPIALVGKVVTGLRWNDGRIMEHLYDTVVTNHIDIMLPFVDPAIEIAARFTQLYPDVWAPVVEPGLADALFDKAASASLFASKNLPIPATYTGGRPTFPLIAKPRHGSASKGIMVIKDVADFRRVLRMGDYMMERYIESHKEYTVDAYVSQRGEILCVSPRLRIEVLGGEVTRSITVDYPELYALARRCIAALELKGPVTLQFIRDEETGELMLMEVNPRLGGGVVCSIHAGADMPRLLLEEYLGLGLKPVSHVKPGVLICRFFDETVFNA